MVLDSFKLSYSFQYRYEATASFATQPGLSESSLNSRNPLRSAFDPELKYDLGLKWILSPR